MVVRENVTVVVRFLFMSSANGLISYFQLVDSKLIERVVVASRAEPMRGRVKIERT